MAHRSSGFGHGPGSPSSHLHWALLSLIGISSHPGRGLAADTPVVPWTAMGRQLAAVTSLQGPQQQGQQHLQTLVMMPHPSHQHHYHHLMLQQGQIPQVHRLAGGAAPDRHRGRVMVPCTGHRPRMQQQSCPSGASLMPARAARLQRHPLQTAAAAPRVVSPMECEDAPATPPSTDATFPGGITSPFKKLAQRVPAGDEAAEKADALITFKAHVTARRYVPPAVIEPGLTAYVRHEPTNAKDQNALQVSDK